MREAPGGRVNWTSVLLVLGALGFGWLLARGLAYYLEPLAARAASPQHHELRPSGRLGHLYGWLGTGVILSNLLYLVRRRLAWIADLGSMKGWLRWHVVSGILGPLLVVLHSALTLRSTVAIASSVSLGVVVLSGVAGRYLYALVPRARDGAGRRPEDVRADLDRALMRLRSLGLAGLRSADAVEIEADRILAAHVDQRQGIGSVRAALTARVRLRALAGVARHAAEAARASAAELGSIDEAVREVALLELRSDARPLVDAAAVAWRAVHRVFAFLMLWTAALHTTVAIYLGYGL